MLIPGLPSDTAESRVNRCAQVLSERIDRRLQWQDATDVGSILHIAAISTNGERELRGSPLARAVKFTELTRQVKV